MPRESALRRAAHDWWQGLSGPWMLLWLATLGLGGGGMGSYFAYGQHTRLGVVGITVGAAGAGLLTAFFTSFLLHWMALAPRRQRDDALKVADDLKAVLDARRDRRRSINARFEYDGHLYVYVSNLGPSLPDARINLFVPKLDGLMAKRLDEQGREVGTGHTAEVGGYFEQGVNGAFRWSELHMYLPGANTTWGLMFDIGRVWKPTQIKFGLNADELGDWKWWSPTIHPLEGDE
jgi:hypothetical protein